MLGRKPCRRKAHERGIFVEVRCEDGNPPGLCCVVSATKKPVHVVNVKNLLTYPMDIRCDGLVAAVPKKCEFTSPVLGTAPTNWVGTAAGLSPLDEYEFRHAVLVASAPALAGEELVNATVNASWPSALQPRRISVNVTVTIE